MALTKDIEKKLLEASMQPSQPNVIGNRRLRAYLANSDDNGPAKLIIGPGTKSHNIQLYAKMPTREQLEKVPLPMGMDRESLTFNVNRIIHMGTLPPHVGCVVYWVMTKHGYGKVDDTDIHAWERNAETAGNPALLVDCPPLLPGDWIAIEMRTSYRTKRARSREKVLELSTNQNTDIPTMATYFTTSLVLDAELRGLPTKLQRPLRVLTQDPFGSAAVPSKKTA